MKIVKSNIVCVPRSDIDTDLIIPAKYLKITDKKGLAEGLFANLRALDQNFPFNLPEYRDAEILVAGDNFGCGSSREHAAWALNDWGIKVVIAPSFADIFYNNAMKNQVLPIPLPEETVEKIFEEQARSEKYEIEIDLPGQKVKLADGTTYDFEIDPYRKKCLIEEIDDLDYLLQNKTEIEEFDQKHSAHIFFNTRQ